MKTFLSVTEAILQRKAHHFFQKDQKISRNDFEKLIEVAKWTPSGYNAQPWAFCLVQKEENLEKIHEAAFFQDHSRDSGNAVVLLGNKNFLEDEQWRILHEWREIRGYSEEKIQNMRRSLEKERSESQKMAMTLRNSALIAMNFMLLAEEMGWQTCPMMGFDHKKLKKAVNADEKWIPVLLIALGKADLARKEPDFPRKTAKELIFFEKMASASETEAKNRNF